MDDKERTPIKETNHYSWSGPLSTNQRTARMSHLSRLSTRQVQFINRKVTKVGILENWPPEKTAHA